VFWQLGSARPHRTRATRQFRIIPSRAPPRTGSMPPQSARCPAAWAAPGLPSRMHRETRPGRRGAGRAHHRRAGGRQFGGALHVDALALLAPDRPPRPSVQSPPAVGVDEQVKERRSRRSTSLSAPAGSAPARPVILFLGIAMTLSTITCDSSFRPVVLPAGTGIRNRGAASS